MKNPENPSFDQPEKMSPDIINALIDTLNEKTEIMSFVTEMTELPEFQEMMKLGEDAFPHILSDKENFSHWHNAMTQYIARDIGEPIEFPEEIRTKVAPVFSFVIKWLENRELAVSKRKSRSAITAQRAIINSELYWHGKLMNSDDIHRAIGDSEDPRS